MRRELQKMPIMCRGQNNGIFKKRLNLGTKLGEGFFFRDYLILETKINKNAPKVSRFLMSFKNMPQMEKGY